MAAARGREGRKGSGREEKEAGGKLVIRLWGMRALRM